MSVDGLFEGLGCKSAHQLLKHGAQAVGIFAEFNATLPFTPLVVLAYLRELIFTLHLRDFITIGISENSLPFEHYLVVKRYDFLAFANTDT